MTWRFFELERILGELERDLVQLGKLLKLIKIGSNMVRLVSFFEHKGGCVQLKKVAFKSIAKTA